MSFDKMLADINPNYLQELKNANHFTAYLREGEFQFLTIRGLDVSQDGLEYIFKAYVIYKNDEVYLYDNNTEKFTKCEKSYRELYQIINPIYQVNNKVLESYVVEIDKLEDSLFERKASRIFTDIWFDFKKDLARIERYINRNHLVIKSFIAANKPNENFQYSDFKELSDQILYKHQSATVQLSRLDALYNYYNSIKNDKLNHNLYTLTVLSAIFLPLNLIVGFFGMNTENLFFKENPSGTENVLTILVVSFLLSIFGIPFIRFIDNHFLQKFLGRYDIYNKISRKIDKFEDLLKL